MAERRQDTDIDSILNGKVTLPAASTCTTLPLLSNDCGVAKSKPSGSTMGRKSYKEYALQSTNLVNSSDGQLSMKVASTSDKPKKLRRKSVDNNDASVAPDSPSSSSVQRKQRFSQATTERSAAAKIYFEHYFDRIFTGKSSSPTAATTRTRRRIQIEHELDKMNISDAEKTRIRQEWLNREHQLTRSSRDKMSADKFLPLKPLGRGAFGTVQLVKEKSTNVVYAMKILDKTRMLRENQESHVRAERDLLSEAASTDSCKWLVRLIYSFQDVDYLYFCMEYLQGGDLLSLLIQFDTFPEDMARFYAAEMLMCLEETHKLGYVHRDCKPDNFLIDGRGHLKLGDCGLATDFHWSHESKYYELVRKQAYKASKMTDQEDADLMTSIENERRELDDYLSSMEIAKQAMAQDAVPQTPMVEEVPVTVLSEGSDSSSAKREALVAEVLMNVPPSHKILTWRARSRMQHPHARNYSVVGTNNYIAPEVLAGTPYDFSCDWWSFAVIVFEMLYGYPPFASKSKEGTRQKIQDYAKWLKFPSYVTRKDSSGFAYAGEVSRDARDLIRRILSDKDDRLGSAQLIAKQQGVWDDKTQDLPFSSILNMMLLGSDAQAVRQHPWFRGVDFARISEQRPPWAPDLQNDTDTRYFDAAVVDSNLSGPYAANLGKEVEAGNSLGSGNECQDDRDELQQDDGRLDVIHSQDSENVGGGEDLSDSMLDLRKRLAFVGFTYKSAASTPSKSSDGQSFLTPSHKL